MGSYSHLRIGRLNIDWRKNWLADHSVLFSESDSKNIVHYYADNFEEENPGHSRKLKSCKLKLELLGYSDEYVKKVVNDYIKENELLFSFEALAEAIKLIDIKTSIYDEDSDFFDSSEFARKIENVIKNNKIFDKYKNNIYEIVKLTESFDAYSILILFLMLNIHEDEEVVWEYNDLIKGGWIDPSDINLSIHSISRFLLITEGSTDTKILKGAFSWIYPDIAEFFDFIDMAENYPFTGVGNIVNFYHGICKIGSDKKIIFVFDNDTAGNSAMNKCVKYENSNIQLISLPNYSGFKNFKTIGPNGESEEDINRKAVAIEMFLDLSYKIDDKPKIRWTSYDEKVGSYQGSLIKKDVYTKQFFKAFNKRDKDYSLEKLKILLDSIIESAKDCVQIV